jgi:hypothetical protein
MAWCSGLFVFSTLVFDNVLTSVDRGACVYWELNSDVQMEELNSSDLTSYKDYYGLTWIIKPRWGVVFTVLAHHSGA